MRNINQLHYKLPVRDVNDSVDKYLRRVVTADKRRVEKEVLLPMHGLSRIECSKIGSRRLVLNQKERDIDLEVRAKLMRQWTPSIVEDIEESTSSLYHPESRPLSRRKSQEKPDEITVITSEGLQQHVTRQPKRMSISSVDVIRDHKHAISDSPNNRSPLRSRKNSASGAPIAAIVGSLAKDRPEGWGSSSVLDSKNSEQSDTESVTSANQSPIFQRVKIAGVSVSGTQSATTSSNSLSSTQSSQNQSGSGNHVNASSIATDNQVVNSSAALNVARKLKKSKKKEKHDGHDGSLWQHKEIRDLAESINEWYLDIDREFLLKPVPKTPATRVPVASTNAAAVDEVMTLVKPQTIEEPDEEEREKDPAWQMRHEAFSPVDLEPILRKCRPAFALTKSTANVFLASEKRFSEVINRFSHMILEDEDQSKKMEPIIKSRQKLSPQEERGRAILKSRSGPNPLYVHSTAPPPTNTPLAIRRRIESRKAEAKKPKFLQYQPLINVVATCKSAVRTTVIQSDGTIIGRKVLPSRQRSVK